MYPLLLLSGVTIASTIFVNVFGLRFYVGIYFLLLPNHFTSFIMRPLEYSTLQLSTVHYIVLIISVVYIFHSSDDNSVYGAFNYNECSDSYCLAYGNCPKFSCKGSNKIILRNVTECGCCHRCVEELGLLCSLIFTPVHKQLLLL